MSNVQGTGSLPPDYPNNEDDLHLTDAIKEPQSLNTENFSCEIQSQNDLDLPLSTRLFVLTGDSLQNNEALSVKHNELMHMGKITSSRLMTLEGEDSFIEPIVNKEASDLSLSNEVITLVEEEGSTQVESSDVILEKGKLAELGMHKEIINEKSIVQSSLQTVDPLKTDPKDLTSNDLVESVDVVDRIQDAQAELKEHVLEDFFDVPVDELAWMLAPEVEKKEQEKKSQTSSSRSSYMHLDKQQSNGAEVPPFDIYQREEGHEREQERDQAREEDKVLLDAINQKTHRTVKHILFIEDHSNEIKEDIPLKRALVISKGDGVKAVPDFLLKQERFYPFRAISDNSYKVKKVSSAEAVNNDILKESSFIYQPQLKKRNVYPKHT